MRKKSIPASRSTLALTRGNRFSLCVRHFISVAALIGFLRVVGQAVEVPGLAADHMPRVLPRSPIEAVGSFVVRAGFHAELVAAEPLISSPVAVAVDESGAAYVVEMRDYSEHRPEQLGRITRLTDTDGDGKYDRATVFLDHLPWPTAVTCWDGGVFLGSTPDILYAKDTNGDGVADIREVVFTGFASNYAPYATNQLNVQALLNSFQWGLDQRIHGATSVSGGKVRRVESEFTRKWRAKSDIRRGGITVDRNEEMDLSGRDFSFDPRTLELRSEPGGGQHGMSFDDAGRKFVCSNSDHLQLIEFNDLVPNPNPFHEMPSSRQSIAVDGAAAEVFRQSPDEPWRVLRTKWRVAGVVPGMIEGGGRPSGYFTGATGVTIYRGDAYGPDFAGDAFIADCGSNLIHRKKLRRSLDGLSLVGERATDEAQSEFLASTDNWFRPVQFYNAPDGCLWVVDMYRETIEHPWSLPLDLKRHLDLDSGRDRGRLWRLSPDQPPSGKKHSYFQSQEPSAWVRGLEHPNGWHRDTAARLLHQAQASEVVSGLRGLLAHSPHSLARLHALQVLAGYGALADADWARAARDLEPAMRRHAFQKLGTTLRQHPAVETRTETSLLLAASEVETDPLARLEIAFSLGAVSGTEKFTALKLLLKRGPSLVQEAVIHAAAGLESRLWLEGVTTETTAQETYLIELARVIGRRAETSEMGPVLERAFQFSSATATMTWVDALADGAARRGRKLTEFDGNHRLPACFDTALALATNGSRGSVAAVRLLAWDERPGMGARLVSLLASGPDDIAEAARGSLRRHHEVFTNSILFRTAWGAAKPTRRTALVDLWLRQTEGARTLLAAAADHAVDSHEWNAAQIVALRNHGDAEVQTTARRLLGEPPASRQAVIEQFVGSLGLRGDPAKGAAHFRERCATCHAFHGEGTVVGPDLASVAANGPEKLLVAILDPNREVAPNFAAWTAETADDETLSGIKLRDTVTTVTLRQAGGTDMTLDRARLRRLDSDGRSLMPEGLEQGWQSQDLADVLAYLSGVATGSIPNPSISTVAGIGRTGNTGDGGLATAAALASPFGLVRGPDGALWFCEYDGHRVRRLALDGTLSTVAGRGTPGYSGDGGLGTAAELNQPHELRFDAAGNLFIADGHNHAIRRLDSRTKTITTFAGVGRAGYSGDGGLAVVAELRDPRSLQFSPEGDLFICDVGNHAVRRVNSQSGVISTFAGTGRPGPTPDGAPSRGTPLNGPRTLDFDRRGDLWLATREGNQVFRFDILTGLIHLEVGTGAKGFTGHGGPAKLATLSGPKGLAIAPNGDVYIADTENHSILRLDAKTGRLERVAGTGRSGDGPDGDPVHCQLNRPHGVWVDAEGSVYLGDSENHRIRRVR